MNKIPQPKIRRVVWMVFQPKPPILRVSRE